MEASAFLTLLPSLLGCLGSVSLDIRVHEEGPTTEVSGHVSRGSLCDCVQALSLPTVWPRLGWEGALLHFSIRLSTNFCYPN